MRMMLSEERVFVMRFFDIVKIFSVVVAVIAVSLMAKKYLGWPLAGTAAMILACCAIMGLDTWKKRHESDLITSKERYESDLETSAKQYESDLAIRLLASIYKYRDALNIFIEPGVVNLYPKSHEEAPHLSEKQRLDQAASDLQNKRYDNVISARQKIYPDILKSEALWDKEMRSVVDAMSNVEVIVLKRFTTASIVNNPDSPPEQKQAARDSLKTMLKEPEKQNDALLKNIDALVKKAEDYLKQKMQWRQET